MIEYLTSVRFKRAMKPLLSYRLPKLNIANVHYKTTDLQIELQSKLLTPE